MFQNFVIFERSEIEKKTFFDLSLKLKKMKITINIKDNKFAFFLELLRNLDFVTIESAEELNGVELSEEHKNILEERITKYKSNPNDVIDWDEFKKEMNKKLK